METLHSEEASIEYLGVDDSTYSVYLQDEPEKVQAYEPLQAIESLKQQLLWVPHDVCDEV